MIDPVTGSRVVVEELGEGGFQVHVRDFDAGAELEDLFDDELPELTYESWVNTDLDSDQPGWTFFLPTSLDAPRLQGWLDAREATPQPPTVEPETPPPEVELPPASFPDLEKRPYEGLLLAVSSATLAAFVAPGLADAGPARIGAVLLLLAPATLRGLRALAIRRHNRRARERWAAGFAKRIGSSSDLRAAVSAEPARFVLHFHDPSGSFDTVGRLRPCAYLEDCSDGSLRVVHPPLRRPDRICEKAGVDVERWSGPWMTVSPADR